MDARIEAVRVAGTESGPVPVVLLAPADETDGDLLPIFIGFDEARSIVHGLDARDIGRPLTHDLALDLVEELGGRIDRVVVSAVEDGTYIADLHVETPRGHAAVDARPSDSLALAARTNAPIEVEPDVFDAGRTDPAEFDEFQDIREVVEL
ncbi:hypothetical protein BRC83_04830 [Halobacteriales archaeon QS_1_68_17]|nr:MAG: hypothetical protein BRC83_04830 [Halobacteriales archaeon QS_1_68_17]